MGVSIHDGDCANIGYCSFCGYHTPNKYQTICCKKCCKTKGSGEEHDSDCGYTLNFVLPPLYNMKKINISQNSKIRYHSPGIYSLSQSCFSNSSMQLLNRMKLFVTHLLNNNNLNDNLYQHNKTAYGYLGLLRHMNEISKDYIESEEYLSNTNIKHIELNKYRNAIMNKSNDILEQEDALEFLSHLLDIFFLYGADYKCLTYYNEGNNKMFITTITITGENYKIPYNFNKIVHFGNYLIININRTNEYLQPYNLTIKKVDEQIQINSNSYFLIAVIQHIMTQNSTGHYITYIKYDTIWYSYNDHDVQSVKNLREFEFESESEFLFEMSPDPNFLSFTNERTPYILLYEKI
jgi:hypothetical protein